LDDALAAVDGHVAMRIWRNVCEFRRRRGLTTLMSLNQRQFLPLFDRYVELKNGRIVREVVNTKKKEQKKEEEEEEKQEKELNEIDEKCGDEGKSVMIEKKDDLISEETRRLGALDMSAFTFFFKRVGGWRYAISVVVLGIFAYALMAAGDLWLAAWVRSPLFYFHSLHFLGQQHTHTHIYIYIYIRLLKMVLLGDTYQTHRERLDMSRSHLDMLFLYSRSHLGMHIQSMRHVEPFTVIVWISF